MGQGDSYLCRWWNVLYTLYVYLDFIVIAICFPRRKRRGRREIKISSGSRTGDFERLIRIEVGQEDSYLCRWRRIAIRSMCARILIIRPFTGPIRGECDTHSCPDTLSYGRFEMNTPHRLRWQWGVVFREELESLVREGEGWVSGELSLLALELL